MSQDRTQSSILWQNDDRNITLLDVPGSIAAAQGTKEAPFHGRLISSEPLQLPFASNEPKTPAARAKLERSLPERLLDDEYCRLLKDALKEVHDHHTGPWCFPRPFIVDKPHGKKRKVGSVEDEATSLSTAVPPSMSEIASAPPDAIRVHVASLSDSMIDGDMCKNRFHFVTSKDTSVPMTTDDYPTYRSPSRSCAILDDCTNADVFQKAVRSRAERDGSRPEFDFILLDPPWPNRSVKRTYRTAGSTYATVATLRSLKELLLSMRLDTLMSDNCLVGIWITNKPAVREMVLGHGGLFDQWGLRLEEEWIWLKTTMHGEPVTQLDALWRKPYEVLLLGRKQNTPSTFPEDNNYVVRRIIMAVPDLHSRKPCLKTLIEAKMPDASSYRALEVFARHLVAEWWSWGNECIKYNWIGCWKS